MIHSLRKRFILFCVLVISIILIVISSFIFLNPEGELSIKRWIVTIIVGITMVLIGSLILSKIAIAPIKRAWQKQLDFTADASHELRTPLAVIRTNLELIMDCKEESVESQMKWLKNIDAESQRMTKLIDDLLTLSRADTNRQEFEQNEFPLEQAVNEAVMTFEGVAKQKGICLHMQMNKKILFYGDRKRIKQMLIILLDNAIWYSGASDITVSVIQNKRHIEINVRDNGCGIGKEHLEHLFDRFYRVEETRNRNPDGVGLGLPIAKWIVEGHGGKILVKSALGEETEFRITFPV
ncbi:MAG: HAMP domain-containing histidine kinase [Lachnospiraceae bacterium]|nr:HAMP domain-containing histidine kinase [Lachnospiraceae bacterium]